MSRYIYITDDCLMDIAYEHMDDNALIGLQNALEEIQTADVVEVVRCKNCKHYIKACFEWNDDDDFCSHAERRNDEV